MKDLKAETDKIVAAIVAMGHSEALATGLKEREAEQRELSAIQETSHELSAEEIRNHINSSVQDIPVLLAKAPELAKTRLAQHVDSIRLQP